MKKLTWQEFEKIMQDASKEGKQITGVIVFKPESFDKEYSEQSRSYEVSSGDKYWNPEMIGSSLYGFCLDGTDQGARLDWYMKATPKDNLGKRWLVDYCYLKDDNIKEAEELVKVLRNPENPDERVEINKLPNGKYQTLYYSDEKSFSGAQSRFDSLDSAISQAQKLRPTYKLEEAENKVKEAFRDGYKEKVKVIKNESVTPNKEYMGIKYIDNKDEFCPICGAGLLYGAREVAGLDGMVYFPWECDECGTRGEAWFKEIFQGHTVMTGEDMDNIDLPFDDNIKNESINNELAVKKFRVSTPFGEIDVVAENEKEAENKVKEAFRDGYKEKVKVIKNESLVGDVAARINQNDRYEGKEMQTEDGMLASKIAMVAEYLGDDYSEWLGDQEVKDLIEEIKSSDEYQNLNIKLNELIDELVQDKVDYIRKDEPASRYYTGEELEESKESKKEDYTQASNAGAIKVDIMGQPKKKGKKDKEDKALKSLPVQQVLIEDKIEESKSPNEIKVSYEVNENNPVWISGIVEYMNREYSVYAKVFLVGSEFGINNGPISKLAIRDLSADKTIVNYERGWDVKPKTDKEKQLLDLVIDSLLHFRSENKYKVEESVEDGIDEYKEIEDLIKAEIYDFLETNEIYLDAGNENLDSTSMKELDRKLEEFRSEVLLEYITRNDENLVYDFEILKNGDIVVNVWDV